ncbi:MAG: IclR family transcriptional regulator [Rhodobacteraceae bacterium]|nr:IclR family transcriptional regulator [Paracoccaceae bacterium]
MQAPIKRTRGRPKSFNDQTDATIVRSLDRGMLLLGALAEGDGISLSELSERADQSAATTYRALITLQSREIVEFEEHTQLWYIGAGAFRIGSVFLNRTNILQRSRPVMQNLMRLIGETANLGIERDDWVLFVSQVESSQTIRAFFPPGTRNPMHASGIGKTLLANFPKDRVHKIITEQGLERFTDSTITEPDELFKELETIKRKGYAVDDEERTEGMRCIASPIFDAYGDPIAGLSISGPTFRIPQNATNEIGEIVSDFAREVTRQLGGQVLMTE